MSTWYEKGVFYHMYPLGLTGAPKNNDEPSVVYRFDELMQWIPHIRDLGCSAVYIGPLFESSSHGYDTRDYKLVDRRLGDNQSFTAFVKQCHEADIRVVVDGVFNHTGREFFAFQDIQQNRESSAYKDWYRGINMGYGSPLMDSFTYDAWQGHYELPCLNLQNLSVKRYLFDVVRYWIDTFGIDGIRLDCANVLDFDFMKDLRSETSRMKEDFWLMGEVIHGDYSRWVNFDMLHSVTNYELHKSIYSAHNDHNYFELAHNIQRLAPLPDKLYTFVDNHDEDRIASKLIKKEHLFPVYLLLFTLPGIPSIYYGGEWAVPGHRSKTSDDVLRPCISMKESSSLHCELTDFIAKLGHIHAENPEFHSGRYQQLLLTNRQYVFCRFAHNSIILVAANNDDKDINLSIPVPCKSTEARNLLDNTVIPIVEGKAELLVKGNYGVILKIMED